MQSTTNGRGAPKAGWTLELGRSAITLDAHFMLRDKRRIIRHRVCIYVLGVRWVNCGLRLSGKLAVDWVMKRGAMVRGVEV